MSSKAHEYQDPQNQLLVEAKDLMVKNQTVPKICFGASSLRISMDYRVAQSAVFALRKFKQIET